MTKNTIKTLDDKQLEQVAGGYSYDDAGRLHPPRPANIGGQQGEEVTGTNVEPTDWDDHL